MFERGARVARVSMFTIALKPVIAVVMCVSVENKELQLGHVWAEILFFAPRIYSCALHISCMYINRTSHSHQMRDE